MLFYTGTSTLGPWQQAGALIDSAASGAIFTAAAALTVGANPYFAGLPGYLGTLAAGPGVAWAPAAYTGCQGLVYELQVRSPASTLLADPQFYSVGEGTASFTDGQGNTWTVAGDGGDQRAPVPGACGRCRSGSPQWTSAATDAWTPIAAEGLLRRLSQKNPPVPSAYIRGRGSGRCSLRRRRRTGRVRTAPPAAPPRRA